MTYSQIVKAISTSNLTEAQLRNLNTLVIDTLKANDSNRTSSRKAMLYVGMSVTVDHKKTVGQEFIVKKINNTKAILTDSNGRGINVPISMIVF